MCFERGGEGVADVGDAEKVVGCGERAVGGEGDEGLWGGHQEGEGVAEEDAGWVEVLLAEGAGLDCLGAGAGVGEDDAGD